LTLRRAVTNAPIFSFVDAYLGKGIVGGPLISVRDVAQVTAQHAVRILNGEKASNVITSGRRSLTGRNCNAGISAKVACRREARFYFVR
jgi:hypothetical protein